MENILPAENAEQIVVSTCFNIGDGGIWFGVKDGKYGPRLEIEGYHFGQQTNGIRLNTNAESLKKLGELLIKASEHEFSNPEYCYVARIEDEIPLLNSLVGAIDDWDKKRTDINES